MSYTHIHLPEIDELKRILSLRPKQIEYYLKYGAWMGSCESMDYLTQKADEYKQKNTSKRV
jgi:hypothetical protein